MFVLEFGFEKRNQDLLLTALLVRCIYLDIRGNFARCKDEGLVMAVWLYGSWEP